MKDKTTGSTHHWGWSIEIQNDFRNSGCRIDHRWYSPTAIYQEAVWAASAPPNRVLPEHRIRIPLRGQEAASVTDKEGALRVALRLIQGAPEPCREYALQELWVVYDTIFGPHTRRDGIDSHQRDLASL